ncbi:WLM domain-containing protein [Amylostereum chailletii]|nr:WLM domain-containing protein [Amylostereum chailletii]
MSAIVSLKISHLKQNYSLSLLPDDTLALLHSQLEELTSVPASNQKLLYKGKKSSHGMNTTIRDAGLKNGMKVTMLGHTPEEVGEMHKAEGEQRRIDQIKRERAARGTVRVSSTGSSASTTYSFRRLEPLPHLPAPDTALALLKRLSSDPAIVHIMSLHKFTVGLLTELAPHEQPHLLGLNVNAGEAIKLRLRTDEYDGFRTYKEVRRVLCHELTHNVWGDHDDNFKELNSLLNRQVLEYENSSYTLGSDSRGDYQPSASTSELEAEARAHVHVLGGASPAPATNESIEERRRKMLETTMSRLRKEEEELEQSCGTASTTSGEAR